MNLFKLFTVSDGLKKSYIDMIFSLLLKFIGMAISFISVPIILKFVDYADYGIYLALTSSFALINILDIGLGDGLRNKFAIAKANDNDVMARSYVSTTYFVNFVLAILIILVYFSIENHLQWNRILNLPIERNEEIKSVARLLIIATSSQFFLQAFLNILKGDQKYISYSVIGLTLNIISVLTVFAMIFLKVDGSIHSLVLAFFIVPNIGLLVINVFYFLKIYNNVYPSVKFVNRHVAKTLTSLSLKFFVINIMSVIALQSINILVIRNFMPSLVVDFNLLFKYYFLLISIAYIIFNPIWSTFTSSITKGEIDLTNILLKKALRISRALILLIPLMILIADWFIQIWTNTNFHTQYSTHILFGIWVALVIYSEPFKMLIKGNGDLNAYLLIAITATVVQIIFSILLIHNFHLSIDGILISCIISQLLYLVFFKIKSSKILTYTNRANKGQA